MMSLVASARYVVILAVLGVAVPASAAHWIDKYGRVLTLQAPGLKEAELHAGSRGATDAASSFKSICLDTGLDRATAGKVAEGAGLAYHAQAMPFTDPVDIGSWQSADAELAVAGPIFFAREGSQCNLTVALAGTPDPKASVQALSALIGAPANAAKATKKDGSADPRWQPEWTITDPSGGQRHVYLHYHQSNIVQFAVFERKEAK